MRIFSKLYQRLLSGIAGAPAGQLLVKGVDQVAGAGASVTAENLLGLTGGASSIADSLHRHLTIDIDAVSGEAFAAGSALAIRYRNDVPSVVKASAAPAGPFTCRGIGVTAADASGVSLKLRVFGVSPIIPDELWESYTVEGQPQGGVPAASRVGQGVYLGKTPGTVTTYRSTHNPESGDSSEFLGWVYSGGTGNARLFVFPSANALYSNSFTGYGKTVLSMDAVVQNFTAGGKTLQTTATSGQWKPPTCPGVPTGIPGLGEASEVVNTATGHLFRWHVNAWVDTDSADAVAETASRVFVSPSQKALLVFSQDQAAALASTRIDVLSDLGGAAAGDVVRYDGAGVLARSVADTVAHASIHGVWDGTRLKRWEPAVVNFEDLPVAGGQCYLSSTAGKARMTPPVLGMAPRRLGEVTRVTNATPGAYQAEVLLDFNVHRDEYETDWLLETWTVPAGGASSHLYSSLSSSHKYRIEYFGTAGSGGNIWLRPNSSTDNSSSTLLQLATNPVIYRFSPGIKIGYELAGTITCDIHPRGPNGSVYVESHERGVLGANPGGDSANYVFFGSTTTDYTSLLLADGFTAGNVCKFTRCRTK